jgi:mRNA-degrading endonuclease RelE of RelBE toxin-antitoxin system
MMDFYIYHAEGFPLELGRAPKKVRNAYQRTVIPALRSAPNVADPPRIKKLDGYKHRHSSTRSCSVWRLRVSDDYRLVYSVDQVDRVVTMLMLDHRTKVYERLGANDNGEPGVRIVARAEELLEREPMPEEIGQAELILATTQPEPTAPVPDRPLPEPLDPEKLESWGVPAIYHQDLQAARTEGELLALGSKVPVLERVLNGLWPPRIEEIIQKPVRMALEPSAVESAADGGQSLESFLLKLDDDQKAFVARFDGGRPKGPWLLKGGPGSGKSTVALYCIQSLVRGANAQLSLDDKPLRILFTTFTNSLAHASTDLLKALSVQGGKHTIDVKTVDSLALASLPRDWIKMKVEGKPRRYMQAALAECKKSDPNFSFSLTDAEFLMEEIDWVIVGQGLTTAEEFLAAERAGRGRALGQQQRRLVWRLFEAYRRRMREAEVCLFSERLQQAAEHVAPAYEYVFIDEAQDLKPVAIRFCIGLCQNPSNVFLTADTNQSIYGNGLSWSRVASDLRFQGRARILQRNYRTTAEIWKAITPLAPDAEDADRETLDGETVFRGSFPILARYSNSKSLGVRLNSYLHEALRLERVAPGCAAVLCPTYKEMNEVIQLVNPQFNAKAMYSSDVDLSHPGVKVLTMHAAKGLQFPVVAVVGVETGRLPLPAADGIDVAEHNARQRRLFFVACSRAMRRLIVFANRDRPSPFIAGLSDEQWDIEDL